MKIKHLEYEVTGFLMFKGTVLMGIVDVEANKTTKK